LILPSEEISNARFHFLQVELYKTKQKTVLCGTMDKINSAPLCLRAGQLATNVCIGIYNA